MSGRGHITAVISCCECGNFYAHCTCGWIQPCCTPLTKRASWKAMVDAVEHAREKHVAPERLDDTLVVDVPEVTR